MPHAAEQNNIKKKVLRPDAEAYLLTHTWTGNVRELRNFVEKLVILLDSQEITGPQVARLLAFPQLEKSLAWAATLKQAKDAFEKSFICYTLNANKWNIAKTAVDLEIERSALYKKMEKYKIR